MLIQRSLRENDVTKSKMIKFFSTVCLIVERNERDSDWKLFSIIERATVYIWLVPLKQLYLDHGSRSKVLNSHSFDHHRQNVSQKHISLKITFSLWQNRI